MIPILNRMFESCLDTMGKTGQCRWPPALYIRIAVSVKLQ